MKLMYQGSALLDPMHVKRQRRRAWLKSVCWGAVGVIITLGVFWIFTVLMFTE